jgi:hypothetical protein
MYVVLNVLILCIWQNFLGGGNESLIRDQLPWKRILWNQLCQFDFCYMSRNFCPICFLYKLFLEVSYAVKNYTCELIQWIQLCFIIPGTAFLCYTFITAIIMNAYQFNWPIVICQLASSLRQLRTRVHCACVWDAQYVPVAFAITQQCILHAFEVALSKVLEYHISNRHC